MWLTKDSDRSFVADVAAIGESHSEFAFGVDGVRQFDNDLGEVEVWNVPDVFGNQVIDSALCVFELNGDQ